MAISIPIFTAQLEKSREATDRANIRSAMSKLQSDYLTEAAAPTKKEGNIQYAAGNGTSTYATATITLTQKNTRWADSQEHQVGNLTIASNDIGAGTYVVTLNSDGKFTGKYNTKNHLKILINCNLALRSNLEGFIIWKIPHHEDEGLGLGQMPISVMD